MEKLVKISKESFIKEFNASPQLTAVAPGRINIIGEYTDYNFGLSMSGAINSWVFVSMGLRDDDQILIKSKNFDSSLKFKTGENYDPKQNWQKYIYGAIQVFCQDQRLTSGFNAHIWGNISINAGVSSSAATEVAMMNALGTCYKKKFSDLGLVKSCQQIEHRYLKINSGLLDQYTSQFSKKNNFMIIDFEKLTHNYCKIEMSEWTWIVVDTMVKRELASSNYMKRVKETQNAFIEIQKKYPTITGFRSIAQDHLSAIKDPVLQKRIKHYLEENKRVIDVANELGNNNFEQVGKLLTASHYSLKNNYDVSCEELDFLADEAVNFGGCIGSRMLGGGFGGCTLNLVKKELSNGFEKYIVTAYSNKYKVAPSVYNYEIVDGAQVYA
ncbi:MAG: galactokinase [Bacteroidia bacterium]|nr:galactokinase [Bacteroidia bacterium]